MKFYHLFIFIYKNLWVATFNKGLNRLDLQTGKIQQFVEGPSVQISSCLSAIRDIKSDSQGNVWGASRYGFFRISNENGQYLIHDLLFRIIKGSFLLAINNC